MHTRSGSTDCLGGTRRSGGTGLESQRLVKLSVARDREGNKNGFYWFISSRMNIRECVGLLLNVSEGVVTKDVDRTGVLNIFVFGNPTSLRLVGKSGAR